jgi:hypothetical protein
MKKEEVIVKVQESLGSLFTKDDVVNAINMVEEPKVVEESKQDFIAILNLVRDRIIDALDCYDFDDASNFEISNESFEIDYGNTIKLDDFEVNAYEQKRNILDLIKDAITDLKEEHETRLEIIEQQRDVVELERGEVVGNVNLD